jgi:hypothetical protein
LEEKGGGLQAKEYHPNHEALAGSIMLWGCFVAGGTGELHKIDGIKLCRNIEAKSQDTSQLNLGHKWVFQMDNDPKHTSKVVATKSRYWSGHHKALISIL